MSSVCMAMPTLKPAAFAFAACSSVRLTDSGGAGCSPRGPRPTALVGSCLVASMVSGQEPILPAAPTGALPVVEI